MNIIRGGESVKFPLLLKVGASGVLSVKNRFADHTGIRGGVQLGGKFLSRKVLYGKVWRVPLAKLGPELGISGTGLKKICVRHEIPTPPQGWWSKLAAGHDLQRPTLPKASSEQLETVRIYSDTKSKLDARISSSVEGVARIKVPEEVPGELPNWIAKAFEALRSRRVDEKGLLSYSAKTGPKLSIAPECVDRTICFLVAFEKAVQLANWKLVRGEEGLEVCLGDERVPWRISDKLTRKFHQPTESELAQKLRNERWGISSDPWPKYDYHAAGILEFVVEGKTTQGLRRTWGDTSRGKLEDQLPKIIQGFAIHAEASRERKRQREEALKEAAERAERFQAEQKLRQRNERLFKIVEEVDARLGERNALERVSAHLDSIADPNEEIRIFKEWIAGHRDSLEVSVGGDALRDRLRRWDGLGDE